MTTDTQSSVETVEIRKEIEIAAPIEIAFAAMLDELGPDAQMMDGTPMPFKLETWPGGRWFRDLGHSDSGSCAGHLWGHVQVIKPPNLLEIYGPLMMPYPAANHLQYRFTAEGSRTRLAFVHRGIGLITAQHREGMPLGWGHWAERIGQRAERNARK
jgi:uncharacterized protein YndB with AHSA1/START domain